MSESNLNKRQLKKIHKKIKAALLNKGVSEIIYEATNTASIELENISTALLFYKFPQYKTDQKDNENLLNEFRNVFSMSAVGKVNYILKKWYK